MVRNRLLWQLWVHIESDVLRAVKAEAQAALVYEVSMMRSSWTSYFRLAFEAADTEHLGRLDVGAFQLALAKLHEVVLAKSSAEHHGDHNSPEHSTATIAHHSAEQCVVPDSTTMSHCAGTADAAEPNGNSAAVPAMPNGNSVAVPAEPDGNSAAVPAMPNGNSAAVPAEPNGNSDAVPAEPKGNSAAARGEYLPKRGSPKKGSPRKGSPKSTAAPSGSPPRTPERQPLGKNSIDGSPVHSSGWRRTHVQELFQQMLQQTGATGLSLRRVVAILKQVALGT